MRVVLDTSVMVAAVRSRSGASRLWLSSILRGNHIAVISVPLIIEYEAVLTRPEHLVASNAPGADISRLLDGLCSVAVHVQTNSLWRPRLRDPDDEMVLEAAAQGSASTILTFNTRDFAGCERFGIQALHPGTAWQAAQGK
jgi:putative PIN family toxin of toxin-antitoxin system